MSYMRDETKRRPVSAEDLDEMLRGGDPEQVTAYINDVSASLPRRFNLHDVAKELKHENEVVKHTSFLLGEMHVSQNASARIQVRYQAEMGKNGGNPDHKTERLEASFQNHQEKIANIKHELGLDQQDDNA